MRAIINAIKHYVQFENTEIASGARRTIVAVRAVGQSLVTDTEDVVEGSIIKAIFIEIWVHSKATAGLENKFQLVVAKHPSGSSSISFTEMNNLMAYDNKKNILLFSQGVTGDLTTQSIPIVRQWFKIPKGKQRFGLGDRLDIAVSATGFVFDSCGFCTFKEYK